MADNNQTTVLQNYTVGSQPVLTATAASVPPVAAPSVGETPPATVFTPPKSPGKKFGGKNFIIIGVLILFLAGLILGFGKARSFLSRASGEEVVNR